MTNNFQRFAGRLSGDIHGIRVLQAVARLEIRHAFPRIGDAHLSGKMTLFADTIPRGAVEFRWIEDRPGHGLVRMRFTRPMAAVTGNAFCKESRRSIAVQSVRNRFWRSRMAQQALQRHRPREVRMTGLFVTRSDIPEAAIGVVGERRLKKMIANPNQIAEGVRTGANHVRDALLAAFTVALKHL